MSNDFLKIFKERGYLHQITDEDGVSDMFAKSKTPCPVYIGFDCTATSLHVGSLVQIMILRVLQKAGHKPIVLLGGGTTKVGDPSGKDATRQLQTDDGIAKNMAGIKALFAKFLKFGDESTDAILVNNDEWLSGLGYINFLRDVGRHFSVNKMLSFESVKIRLEREQNLSFLEFNYMLLQAYDFVELFNKYGCRVQIGGSDQWGNIVNGIELQRRMNGSDEGKQIFGLTTPLITTSSGAKMGKTADGAVWLTDDLVSPYDYWQFWRNTDDKDVGRFLRLFTELPLDEIERLEQLEGAEINQAKIILANEATKICHGEQAAIDACDTAKKTFEGGKVGNDLPVTKVTKEEFAEGVNVIKALQLAGLVATGGEAKRLVKGGGARINDVQAKDGSAILSSEDFDASNNIKISAGKKKHALLTVE